jgi:endoglycosylceramidase
VAGRAAIAKRGLAVIGAAVCAACAAPAVAVASPTAGPFRVGGSWVVDRQGRVVVMHGFDIVKKLSPYYPSAFTATDARFLASEGVTAARIGFIWAGVEPQPGVYDDNYIRHVIALASLLERYGIHPLIDFHQDTYGTWDPVCANTSVCNIASGDGAPPWAQLCTNAPGQLPAGDLPDECNFQQFWDNKPAADGVGIQTHFINAWVHVARMLDASPASPGVLGLDPFNEPGPGDGYPSCGAFNDYSPCPAFEQTQLYTFYTNLIAALRANGDRHAIFPEGIAQNAQVLPSLPKFSDPDVGFNWHYYCGASQDLPEVTGVITNQTCTSQDASAEANILKYTDGLGRPWLLSEFGGNEASPEYANEVDWMDLHFLSWMEWMYYNAATEPANAEGQGLLIVDALGGSQSNANQQKLDALVVPYAQAIAGTPASYSFDRSSHTMALSYRAQAVPGANLAPGALTRIFIPTRQYPNGYQLAIKNGRELSRSGQWIQVAAGQPDKDVTVTITSRASAAPGLPGAGRTGGASARALGRPARKAGG